ncbi:hypothetical protein Tco_1359848 [Tanacetum coccineum]
MESPHQQNYDVVHTHNYAVVESKIINKGTFPAHSYHSFTREFQGYAMDSRERRIRLHPSLDLKDIDKGKKGEKWPKIYEDIDTTKGLRRCHTFEAQTFPEPIMYLDDLASYWEYALSAPIILFDREEMSFRNFMKKPSQTPTFSVRPSDQPIDVDSPFVDHSKAIDDNDQGESSFVLKNQDVVGFELAVVGDSPSDQGIGVVESSKKKRSITTALKEGATVIKLDAVGSSSKHESRRNDVKEAYSAHNVLSGLHHPSLKNKPDSLSLDDLANVYDVHALNLTMIGNMLTNKSRVVSLDYSKLKSDFLSFRSKNGLLEHEMSTLEDSLSRARKNQDVESSQKLFDEFDRVRPSVEEVESLGKKCKDLEAERESLLSKESSFREEVDALSSRLKIADLKKVELVRDFLPLAVKKLFSSKHFNSALDVEDYNPEAEKVLDEAVEAFYKLDFPYISLLVEKSGESLCSLVVVDPPTIQEAPPL